MIETPVMKELKVFKDMQIYLTHFNTVFYFSTP